MNLNLVVGSMVTGFYNGLPFVGDLAEVGAVAKIQTYDGYEIELLQEDVIAGHGKTCSDIFVYA